MSEVVKSLVRDLDQLAKAMGALSAISKILVGLATALILVGGFYERFVIDINELKQDIEGGAGKAGILHDLYDSSTGITYKLVVVETKLKGLMEEQGKEPASEEKEQKNTYNPSPESGSALQNQLDLHAKGAIANTSSGPAAGPSPPPSGSEVTPSTTTPPSTMFNGQPSSIPNTST